MSGFLPDLANWALRGGAGNAADGDSNNDSNMDAETSEPQEPIAALTPEEMRAQRLARMEQLQQKQQASAAAQAPATEAASSSTTPEPMDVDEAAAPAPTPAPVPTKKPAPPPAPAPAAATPSSQKKQKKANGNSNSTPNDAARKQQRKKEMLVKKILSISLGNSSSNECVVLDDPEMAAQPLAVSSITEILAWRLSQPKDAPALKSTVPPQKPLMAYLAQAHKRAADELKSLQSSLASKKGNASNLTELQEFALETQRQVVSYAASCLQEPDLFEAGQDAVQQLANCFISAPLDPVQSIVVGVSGASSSFWYVLMEELIQQKAPEIDGIVQQVVTILLNKLLQCESVLDGGDGSTGGGCLLISALNGVALHKRSAVALTKHEKFLLPAAGSPQANHLIRPAIPSGAQNLFSMFTDLRPYAKRSGPALEKQTIMGACLRLGVPRNNPAFSPSSIVNQSLDAVERATSSQRSQLSVCQEASCQFVRSLVKGGPEARKVVEQWFSDALLVNKGASALRPDPSKVSSIATLLNLSIVFLKLCEPIMDDEKKQALIDPGFVSSEPDHCGVYATTGDDVVPRLGETNESGDEGGEGATAGTEADGDATMTSASPSPTAGAASAAAAVWNPKNKFIPMCFFFCARSLHLGICPALQYHEGLLRHISHSHYEINAAGRDVRSDPHFGILLAKQRSAEVALFQPNMVTDSLRFANLMAKVLYKMDDESLKQMPEDFATDLCGMIMSIAKMKPRLLQNVDLRSVFQVVVKLLSAKYAGVVRNYNLRAMLGDVLYELFLPTSTGVQDRRDIPISVWTDPLAGGTPYLLADANAKETLAPSLLLLYGEVEHTGYYDKMSHRAKIASLIQFLWDSKEHRPAFRVITQNKVSFIKFANGIMNETNTLIATVMQKLPEIREAQERMKDGAAWGQLSEDEQNQISSRLDDNEREVKHALPLCNKTLQMFGYLNTDPDIRSLFLLDELCPRLVTMLLHVLTKLVGSKGLDLKVDNPENYEFRPKEMLRDLCAIFALFASSESFQEECAKSGCDPTLLQSAVKTCRRLVLLEGESMTAFEQLPDLVRAAMERVRQEEALREDAPDEFLDEILSTWMKDPVILPSGHVVDRGTITQHLLNDPTDPFNREPLKIEQLKPATELKLRMQEWLQSKTQASEDSKMASATSTQEDTSNVDA